MAQRQPSPPAAPVQAKPATTEQPRRDAPRPEKVAAQKQATAEQARKTEAREAKRGVEDAAKDAASVTPMAQMLAMVASFNMPQQAAAEAVPDALAGTAGKAIDAQLAALQNGLAKMAPGTDSDASNAASLGAGDAKFSRLIKDAFDTGPVPLETSPEPVFKVAPETAGRNQPDLDAATTRATPDFGQTLRRMPEGGASETAVSGPLAASVQQASLALNQAVNPAASDKLAARVGTTAWDNQVAQKIIYMVGGEEMSASLTLNPPDLGPMQVVLNVNNDHTDVTFSAATPEVRQALEDALPKLREMMNESGISLGNASVDDGSRQQAQEEAARAANAAGRATGANGSAAEAEAQQVTRTVRTGELPGLVNTFA